MKSQNNSISTPTLHSQHEIKQSNDVQKQTKKIIAIFFSEDDALVFFPFFPCLELFLVFLTTSPIFWKAGETNNSPIVFFFSLSLAPPKT